MVFFTVSHNQRREVVSDGNKKELVLIPNILVLMQKESEEKGYERKQKRIEKAESPKNG